MNIDCIFNVLQYFGNNDITNLLSVNKYITKLNTEYLWKLLCERDYSHLFEKTTENSGQKLLYKKYILCHKLNKLNKKLNKTYNLNNLENIHILDLANEKCIPKELSILTNLKSLNIKHIKIAHVPKEIGILQKLTALNLSNNNLTSLPKELFTLNNLGYLYLHNNKLTHISTNIKLLINLRVLFLHQNMLTNIPNEIYRLSELISLSIHDNQLTILQKTHIRDNLNKKVFIVKN